MKSSVMISANCSKKKKSGEQRDGFNEIREEQRDESIGETGPVKFAKSDVTGSVKFKQNSETGSGKFVKDNATGSVKFVKSGSAG